MKRKGSAMEIERRIFQSGVELRAKDAKAKTLVGYGALYNSRSEDLGGFVEEIAPGAFDESLASGVDVLARAEHDSRMLLGRRSSGTLRLSIDNVGLRYEVDLPDTTVGRDIAVLCARGDVKQSSFAFFVENPKEDEAWSMTSDGRALRTLKRVSLVDVAPVAQPAYVQTSVSARALEAARDMGESTDGGLVPQAKPTLKKKPKKKPTRTEFDEAIKRGLIRKEQRAATDSYEEKLEAIWYALYDLFGSPFPFDEGECWEIEATFDDHVIVEQGYQLLSYPLTWGSDGAPVFGDPTPVVIQYVAPDAPQAVPEDDEPGDDLGSAEAMGAATDPLALPTSEARAAGGATDLTLAEREKPWDAAAAEQHVRNWASQDHSGDKSEMDWAKYGKAFFWHAEKPAGFGDFRLGFADVIGGELKAIPRGIFAVAAVLEGGRGGSDIPEAEQASIKATVAAYYSKMRTQFNDKALEAPWERSAAVAEVLPPAVNEARLRLAELEAES